MDHFIYYCFLILIIIFFAYTNSIHSVEHFTPTLRQTYRPVIRNTRLITEGFYNKVTTNISNLFRKYGLL
jgi:hypothetical protein